MILLFCTNSDFVIRHYLNLISVGEERAKCCLQLKWQQRDIPLDFIHHILLEDVWLVDMWLHPTTIPLAIPLVSICSLSCDFISTRHHCFPMKYAFNTFKCKLNVSVQLLTKVHLICGIVLYQYNFKLSSGSLWWHVSIRSCSAALIKGPCCLICRDYGGYSRPLWVTWLNPHQEETFPFSVSFATLLFHSLLFLLAVCLLVDLGQLVCCGTFHKHGEVFT